MNLLMIPITLIGLLDYQLSGAKQI